MNGIGPASGPEPKPGPVAHYGDPLGEQRLLAAGRALVDLSHLGVVRVSGSDRLDWLHTLTTQSLRSLAPGASTEALILSPKGRIEHAFGLVDDGEAAWLILDGSDAAASLVAWLDSMRFARRIEVRDVSEEVTVVGESAAAERFASASSLPKGPSGAPDGLLAWNDPWPAVSDGGTRYGPDSASKLGAMPEPGAARHPGTGLGLRLTLHPRQPFDAILAGAQGMKPAGLDALEALRIAAWRPRFSSEVDGTSLPHELDWLRTAVHLNKGCYRGQEAVAHVHNLGRPPRRIVFLHLDGSGHEVPPPGSNARLATDNADGAVIGRLTSSAMHYELGPIGLAVIRRATPVDAPLLVSAPDSAEVVSAAQEPIVPVDGISVDRPASRGPLTRGLMSPGRSLPGAGAAGGGVRVFGPKP